MQFQNDLCKFYNYFLALKGTTDALQQEGFQCTSYLVDISDKEQVYATAQRVKQDVGKVDVLVNNAGIVTCRTFLDLPDKAIESTYGVNILSHYWVNFN
jgi:all-trans-retinol dehydrogenase (NAD+)